MNKKYFKIIFYDEEHKPLTVCAQNVHPSNILGFIDVEKLIFMDPSNIILTPDDDKIRNIFKNVEKIMLPLNHIIRIDELNEGLTPVIVNISQTEKINGNE